jgi:hypothetical protein
MTGMLLHYQRLRLQSRRRVSTGILFTVRVTQPFHRENDTHLFFVRQGTTCVVISSHSALPLLEITNRGVSSLQADRTEPYTRIEPFQEHQDTSIELRIKHHFHI